MRFSAILAATTMLLSASLARADEAADTFNSLYGNEVKRVTATPAAADDLALAKQLLGAAKAATGQPAFLALLCEKAYDLGMKDPAGFPTALAAMELEAEILPAKKADCAQKSIAVHQRQYASARGDAKPKAGEAFIEALTAAAEMQTAAGDTDAAAATLRQALAIAAATSSPAKAAIQTQLTALAARQQADKQLAALKAKLEANPKDDAVRKELVRMCLVELDNPAEAAKFVDDSLDEATQKYVPGAAKPLEEAPELACSDLGKWYQGLADQAPIAAAKGAMLRRAEGYYERFLQLHATDDLARTGMKIALKKAEDSLTRLGAAGRPAGAVIAWTDCLKLVDSARHILGGKAEWKDGKLIGDGSAKTFTVVLPVHPKGSYELEVMFVRTAGDGTVCIFLPVGNTACAVTLSWKNGRASGIELVNEKSVGENETAVHPGKLINGTEYTLTAKVAAGSETAEISVRLNGQPYISWKGLLSALTSPAALSDPRAPALWLSGCAAEFRRARIRAIAGGEIKMPPAPTAAPTPTAPAGKKPKP